MNTDQIGVMCLRIDNNLDVLGRENDIDIIISLINIVSYNCIFR